MNKAQFYELLGVLSFLITALLFVFSQMDLAAFTGFATLYFKLCEVASLITTREKG